MRVTVLAENLQKKLSITNRAISTRIQLPILSHVLLQTQGNTLSLSSTDLEIGIETTLSCQTEEEGSVAVPAKLFLELISSLPQDKITLETKDSSLVVSTKKTKSTLQTFPKDEFPQLYEEKGEKLIHFVKGSGKSIFQKILFCASLESTRPALSGILIKKSQQGMTLVATDGYRLSLEEVSQQEPVTLLEQIIVPARILKEAATLLEESDIELYLAPKNNQILFSTPDTILIGRLIEAQFPNYEKVLPSDVSTKVVFDKEEMQKAVKLCSLFAKDTANIVTLSLKKNGIVVSAQTPSLGQNTVVVEGKLDGEENEIAFNGKYLQEAFLNISAEEVSFEMTGPLNPGVFRIVGKPSFLHLIMPIRTQG